MSTALQPGPGTTRSAAIWLAGPLAIAIATIAAIAWFDMGPPLTFNDDWLYSWSARQLAAGHGLRIMPGQSAFAIVQVLWADLATLGHTDERLLRLSVLPVVLLGAWSSWRAAARLGADRFWSAAAGAAFLATPLFAGVSTSFMTDVFYTGLLLAAAAAATRWAMEAKSQPSCVLWTVLACLERQHGYGIPIAMTLALLRARGNRRVGRRDWAWLSVLWAAMLAAQVAPALLGLGTLNQSERLVALFRPQLGSVALPVLYLPAMLGFCLIPFAVGLWFARATPARGGRAGRLVAVGLATSGVTFAVLATFQGGAIVPGDVVSPRGLMPAHLAGDKPRLFPGAVFLGFECLALLAFLGLLVRNSNAWRWANLSAGHVALLALAATQLVPMAQTGFLDRYYIPALALVIPVAAAIATGAGRQALARGWMLVALAGSLAVYAAGEQDYQAFQQARDQAYQYVLRSHAPNEVDGGLEANAVYWETAYYERYGRPPGDVLTNPGAVPSLGGDHSATIQLRLARPGDPRFGFTYQSLAPGKIVIVSK